ncbi:MAG: radical SAM protein [Actinobacteria bacterium]|nr:radical SAM protein [Actinomycetota bacterium]
MDLRWRLAEDDEGGERSPQAALFPEDELVEHHVGKGEFRGMEFLHVNARRVINELPAASNMPFRFTINAYRGCSHACSYCSHGSTRILMGDGRTKPIADLRVGDEVVGTVLRGAQRLRIVTEVRAQWSVTKPAYKVVLDDGRELVTSADHRFLTTRGWAHVAAGERDCECPRLTAASDELVGAGLEGPRVRAVEPYAESMELYDITTGTGDFIANGVVSHNCFARPTHDYLGLNVGEDFERKIVVKVNAVERVRAELRSKKWRGDPIAMGTNTDPYQRAEGKYHLTRGIIEALTEAANPFSILTKSTLILRDLDLLKEAAHRTSVRTSFSIGTLDERVWKASEPGTPHPRKRVEAVAKLVDAGIPCGVLIAPVLPGLSDSSEQVEEVARACLEAGASSISALVLHLRKGVKEHFMTWLKQAFPELAPEYERLYASRAYLPKADQARITGVVTRVLDEMRPRQRVRVYRRGHTGHERDGASAREGSLQPTSQLGLFD